MAPIIVYSLILLVPVILAVALRYLIVVPRRECPNCGHEVSVTALNCRHCRYRFTAEDREVMAYETARRKRRHRASL